MKLDWQKVPSVITGGKPFFYNAWPDGSSGKKYSVVWHRVFQSWDALINNKAKASFLSSDEAMKFLEQLEKTK